MWGLNPSNIWFDTMIAAWLVNSRISSYSMDSLAEFYLGYETVHFKDIVPKDKLFQDIKLETASFMQQRMLILLSDFMKSSVPL